MYEAVERLSRCYPWPAEKPNVPPSLWIDGFPDGWCCQQNIEMFKRLTPARGIVVELGSWLGRSAIHFMQQTRCEALICIDHWEGSEEHKVNPDWAEKLPTLFETFLVHLWDHRDRVIPMRLDTIAGMESVNAKGIRPDLIYVDASHDPDNVARDLSCALRLFPDAKICGDDWTHESVREGIARIVPLDSVQFDNVCWWL